MDQWPNNRKLRYEVQDKIPKNRKSWLGVSTAGTQVAPGDKEGYHIYVADLRNLWPGEI
jgi:hypothetical protein